MLVPILIAVFVVAGWMLVMHYSSAAENKKRLQSMTVSKVKVMHANELDSAISAINVNEAMEQTSYESTATQIYLFESFLRKKRVLLKYLQCRELTTVKDLYVALKNVHPTLYIMSAFVWMDTSETEFWDNLDREWQRYMLASTKLT